MNEELQEAVKALNEILAKVDNDTVVSFQVGHILRVGTRDQLVTRAAVTLREKRGLKKGFKPTTAKKKKKKADGGV
jgi:chaperonin cofactor prefoldin